MEGDAELQDLYREVLLDYFRSTSRKGKLEPADVRAHGINPVCGDELEITARREGGRISELRYAGHGCVISQASAAMMAEALEGQTEAKARELVKAFKTMMLENAPVSSLPEELEPLSALEGVRKFPLRVKCATLGWNTIAQGLDAAPAKKEV
ncbi:MAG: Fe-S cluster assembly sulfur transfer protein SufU [Elusimicrobiota bacterium]